MRHRSRRDPCLPRSLASRNPAARVRARAAPDRAAGNPAPASRPPPARRTKCRAPAPRPSVPASPPRRPRPRREDHLLAATGLDQHTMVLVHGGDADHAVVGGGKQRRRRRTVVAHRRDDHESAAHQGTHHPFQQRIARSYQADVDDRHAFARQPGQSAPRPHRRRRPSADRSTRRRRRFHPPKWRLTRMSATAGAMAHWESRWPPQPNAESGCQ